MNVRTPQCAIRLYVLIWRDSHVIMLFISKQIACMHAVISFLRNYFVQVYFLYLEEDPKGPALSTLSGISLSLHSCPAVLPSGLVTDTLDLSGKALWGVWGRCLTYSSFLLFSFLGRERGGSGGNKSDLERLKPSFSPWMTWTLPFVVNITSFIDAAPMALRFNCWVTVCKIANQTEVFLLLILSLKLFVHLVQHHPHFMWPARPESNSRVFGLPTPGIEVLVA